MRALRSLVSLFLWMSQVQAVRAAAGDHEFHIDLRPDIRADSNRDGIVSDADADGKMTWDRTRGAIILPNIGDKNYRCHVKDANGQRLSDGELARCHDASGDELLAPEYAAPLLVMPIDLPDDFAGRVYAASPPAAYERIRIFLDVGGPGADRNATESWALIEKQEHFDAAQMAGGLRLAVDAREVVTDSATWDGTVEIKFEVFPVDNPPGSKYDGGTDGGNDSRDTSAAASDSVVLKVAPLLTHHPLQRLEALVSVDGSAGGKDDPGQAYFINQLRDVLARKHAAFRTESYGEGDDGQGVKYGERRVDDGSDPDLWLLDGHPDAWAQDFFEPAYVSMPGPDGSVIAIRVMIRSLQSSRPAGRQVFTQLRGPGIGVLQLSDERSGTGFGEATIESLGNLDTIPPYTSRAGREYPAGRILAGSHFDREMAHPVQDVLEGQGWQGPILMLEAGWLAVGHVDEFVTFVPSSASAQEGEEDLGFTIAVADTRAAMALLRDASDAGHGHLAALNVPAPPPGEIPEETSHLALTIDELLDEPSILEANDYAQRRIDRNIDVLLAEIPFDPRHVVRLPALFFEPSTSYLQRMRLSFKGELKNVTVPAGERQLAAFYPNAVNGVVMGRRFLGPYPFGPVVDGVDLMAREIEARWAEAGIDVIFVDDFHSHHTCEGEVHCGTNALRQTDLAWWK